MSFRHLSNVRLDDVASVNVIVGTNNAGKTSLFRGIQIFSTAPEKAQSGHMFISTRVRPNGFSFNPNFSLSHYWTIKAKGGSQLRFWSTRDNLYAYKFDNQTALLCKLAQLRESPNPTDPTLWRRDDHWTRNLTELKGLEKQLASEHSAWIDRSFYLWHRRKSNYSEPGGQYLPRLDEEAEHLAARLENLLLTTNGDGIRRQIDNFMNSIVPGVGKIGFARAEADRGSQLSIVFADAHGERTLQELGGGVEQALALALVLLGEKDEGAVFIEEPESHLHESAQRRLIQQITEHQGARQVFIATHSPVFVNEFQGANVYRVSRDLASGIASVHPCLNRPAQRDILDELGVLPSSLTQTNCVVWVEGPTEVCLVQHWLKILDPELKLNQHYVFIQTGGSNIVTLAADLPYPEDGKDEVERLRDIKRICRHNFFICDRDAGIGQNPSKAPVQRIRQLIGEHHWITHGYEIEWYFPEEAISALWGEVAAHHMMSCTDADTPFYPRLATTPHQVVRDKEGNVALGSDGAPKTRAVRGTQSAEDHKVTWAIRAVQRCPTDAWFAGPMGEDLRKNTQRLAAFIREANQMAPAFQASQACPQCGQGLGDAPKAS